MNKKIIAAVAVIIIVVAVVFAASQSTKRAEYQAGDLLISAPASDPTSAQTISLMKEALEGSGVNVIAIDPETDPKSVPITDAANMEVPGAMLFYQSDGDHAHEVLVHEQGPITTAEEAQRVLQVMMGQAALGE